METKYRIDRLSYPDPDGQKGKILKQEIIIPGTARTKSSDESGKWRKQIIDYVHKGITVNNLRQIKKNEECNLFVTFYLNKHRDKGRIPDIDNLLKRLLDALKECNDEYIKLLEKQERREYLKPEEIEYIHICAKEIEFGIKKLIPDDRGFRGVRAEREMVKEKPRVHIQYVITRTFKIIEVTENVPGTQFRPYWQHDMQVIKVCEIVDGKESKEYDFIDNMPGQLFLIDNKYAKLIPPGYNWKKHEEENETVEGCMVFLKKVMKRCEEEVLKNERYYWLTKW